MSSIGIESGDDIYGHVMNWLESQKVSKNSRNLMAKTGHENTWGIQERDVQEVETDANKLLNFNNWDAKVPPKFEPSFGSHRFSHRGRIFEFKRDIKKTMSPGWRASMLREEIITLTCIRRSAQPMKDLIKECRNHSLDREKFYTIVRRPAPKDVDSAGLIERQEPEVKGQSKDDDPATKIGAEITKAIKSVQDQNDNPKKNSQGISLSGLLNAIDGVASHEGRVLVMTTNFPERLDGALIRPGRIDIKVNFTMATRSQICELFTRMYSPKDHPSALATSELKEVAEKFAAQLDEKSFTPAEIQGFWLTQKMDPMKALREVEAWKNQVLRSKQEKSKMGGML